MRILRKAMQELNIGYDEAVIEKFRKYRDLVLEWNTKVNLTAVKDAEAFEIRHFVDSLTCSVNQHFVQSNKIIDVGTGAGFPGIPLAICFPEKEFLLLDSLNKRIKILNEIVEVLGLKNVKTLHGRAEDIAKQKLHREKYEVCLSRAVANLAVLSEYCLPLVAIGGMFGAYKSKNTDQEIEDSRQALQILGGKLVSKTEVQIEGAELEHQILWILKIKPTPAKYPRKAGIPAKEPIN